MINDFSDYIEDLCVRHPDILHCQQEKHFVSSKTEKDTSIDSTLHYPAISLDKGDFRYKGDSGAFRKEYQYMLLVIDHVSDTGDHKQIRQKIDKCEKILDDFIRQMIEDKKLRKYKFLNAFSLTDTEGSPVENIDNALYGIIAFIPIEAPFADKSCTNIFMENKSKL